MNGRRPANRNKFIGIARGMEVDWIKALIASGAAVDKARLMNGIAAMLKESAFLWDGRPKVRCSLLLG